MATNSVTGSTNLDVNSIVSQLMTVERQPINRLDQKEAAFQAKLSAFGSVKGAVSGFQTALQGLSSASFQRLNAFSSDSTTVSAATTSSAVAGTYSIEVSALAQAQKLVAAGQTSSTAVIGTGAATVLTFDFGSISGGTFDAVPGNTAAPLSPATAMASKLSPSTPAITLWRVSAMRSTPPISASVPR